MHPNEKFIDPPWNIKIELTRGCNLRCKFCVVHSHPEFQGNALGTEGYKFISLELVDSIARQLAEWVPKLRIEFTLRGEPSLHPHVANVVTILRRHLPKAQMSLFSNGTGWLKDCTLVERVLDAGCNLVCIDCYNNTYQKFEALAKSTLAHRLITGTEDGIDDGVIHDIELADFRDVNGYNRLPNGHRRRLLILVPDIVEGTTTQRKIHDVAGNLSDEQLARFGLVRRSASEPLKKNCARPYRELIIYSNGAVVLCCLDWLEKEVLGSVTDGIKAAWYGDKHLAVLRALYEKKRSGLCAGCGYGGGFRLGLLRDPITGWSYSDQ